MAGVPQETPVRIKKEETDAVANEPGSMALIKGEEEVYIKMENKRIIPITFPDVGNCTPLKGVKDEVSPMSQENEMVQFCPFRINVKQEMEYGVKQEALIKGEEEVYIKMENKRIIPITFPDVANCTPLKGVKDEVSPMSQENEMRCRMAGVPQETPVRIKKEETDAVANEPGSMVQFCPFRINVKQEMEYGVKQEALIKGEEEVYIKMENKRIIPITFPDVGNCTPLKGVKDEVSPMSQENEMALIKGEEEVYIKMENKRIIPITFPDVGNCTPLKGVKDEVSPMSQEKEMFLEDPLKPEVDVGYIRPAPELKQHADSSLDSVLASTMCIDNSTRGIRNCGTSSGISFGETVVRGLVPDELEIHAEESTCLTMFDTHTKGLEVKEENESLFVGRVKCSWRENEFHEFICNFCLHSFSSKYILIMHVFTHIDDLQPPTHICKSCGETFSSEIDLNRHLKMNGRDQVPYSAPNDKSDGIYKHKNIFWKSDKVSVIQQSENQSPPQLKRKALRAAGKKSHKCPVCDKSFSELRNLKRHSLTHTGVKPHKCTLCDKSFTLLGHLKRHSLTHTGVKPHKCKVCDKSFTELGTLKRHSLTHTGVKPHKCTLCDKSFTLLDHLKRHSLTHTGVKPHKCNICDKSFTELCNLKMHSLTHTGVRPHKCTLCDKSFTLLNDLKRHSLTHTGVRPHKCNVCDKYFTLLGDLKRHSLTHTGVKPHKCSVCDKSFTHLGALKRHSLTHTGVQPHKCNVCDKSFTQLGHLKSHSLTHTGVKPHKCTVCDKSFRELGHLKSHSLTHRGVKPHKCSVCDKSFTHLGALKRHSLTHTGVRPHKCNVCDKSFSKLVNLKTHALIHTGVHPNIMQCLRQVF